MGPINTGNDYEALKSSQKKSLIKEALRNANLEQKALIERAEKIMAKHKKV